MSEEYQKLRLNEKTPEYVNASAFNTYATYALTSHAAFYAMVDSTYNGFMRRWVQNWLWWYDGYVPYFHNQQNGIFSTRMGQALVDKMAKKVVGGRVMFKVSGEERNLRKASDRPLTNEALQYVNEWAKDTDFAGAVKRVVRFAAAAGTGLLKINKSGGKYWVDALRFDSFLPTVDFRGRIIDVKCYLQPYTRMSADRKGNGTAYYLVEHRYYGEYTRADGKVIWNAPLATYEVHAVSGSIELAQYDAGKGSRVPYESLPKAVRKSIRKDFGVMIDKPMLLPFSEDMSLGCELVKWTDGVSNLPQVPFGESLLAPVIAQLMAYDYYFSAFNTDMYTGRARVLTSTAMMSPNNGGQNSGMDNYLLTKIPNYSGDDQKPIPLQFDLRSQSWAEIRDHIIQNISILTGINVATIASFLNDSQAQKTAREVSVEENETASGIYEKREIIERPINRIIKSIIRLAGYNDDIVVRWSTSELMNAFNRLDYAVSGVNNGIMSKERAIKMLNPDDDDEQIFDELKTIEEDGNNAQVQPIDNLRKRSKS
ncbi:MAG: phage portal protein [Clostridia bacterium]|nr:phage portal protein [Clostridia bacterium]